MAQKNESGQNAAPRDAKDAVFVTSAALPVGTLPVKGFEFDQHRGKDVSVADLVKGMASMGFQASAIGEAVQVINDMVRLCL